MSDIEEPPMKVTKLEELEEWQQMEALDPECTEGEMEALDEGQEEWLSEGGFTDDDYPVPDHENVDSINTSQELDNTLPSMTSEHLDDSQDQNSPDTSTKIGERNIEDTLNSLEGSKDCELPEDLDTFLIRKTDGVVVAAKVKEEVTKIEKADDGNDTDDLLRMLGEGDEKTKKKVLKTLKVKKEPKKDHSSDDDDDEFVYEGVKLRSLRVAKNALRAAPASRALPEDSDADDDTDASSDEVVTMKKMFGVAKKHNVASKSTSKPPKAQKKSLVKHVVQLSNGQTKKSAASSPVQKTKDQSKSILKPVTPAKPEPKPNKKPSVSFKPSPTIKSEKPTTRSDKMAIKSEEKNTSRLLSVKSEVNTPKSEEKHVSRLKSSKSEEKKTSKLGSVKSEASPALKLLAALKSDEKPGSKFSAALKSDKPGGKFSSLMDSEHDEIIDEEEFLDDDDFDLNEHEFAAESDMDIDFPESKQRIMRPERMDEEIPTDCESHSEDGSLYDELPSSDSDDLDDWFTLDIRAERAGDYIPLLGSNAHKLLMKEKQRVTERLTNLRESLTSLTESGRKQAEQLKDATMSLAELDDMLKAS